MKRDPQLLLSIQLALIGIVLVAGLYFIWRMVTRIEAKIDQVSARSCQDINTACLAAPTPFVSSYGPGSKVRVATDAADATCASRNVVPCNDVDAEEPADDDEYEEEDDDDLAIMNSCFGDIPISTLIDEAASAFMMFGKVENGAEGNEGVVLEEIPDEPPAPPASSAVAEATNATNADDDEGSAVGTEDHEFSKSSLKKKHLDALKDICLLRGLPTTGTKAVLIDRIVSSMPVA